MNKYARLVPFFKTSLAFRKEKSYHHSGWLEWFLLTRNTITFKIFALTAILRQKRGHVLRLVSKVSSTAATQLSLIFNAADYSNDLGQLKYAKPRMSATNSRKTYMGLEGT